MLKTQQYPDYQKRVIEEKEQLDRKLKNLMAFIRGPVFPTIKPTEQERLKRQSYLMDQYSGVLAERISEF